MQWNLIRARKENNETQRDLAELLGISDDGYRKKETGIYQFKGDEMFKIAHHYNKKIEEIFLPSEYTFRKQEEQHT